MDLKYTGRTAAPRRARDRVLLPYGIAMTLLAFGFTFSGNRLRWLWVDTPYVAVLLVMLGVSCLAVAIARRRHASPR